MATLALVHGVGLDATMWADVAALLRRRGHEVVTPTLPGHAGDRSTAAGTSLAELAEAVARDVPEGCHLIGFSLGALVAQHIARFQPRRVATLTMVSSVCDRDAQARAGVMQRLRSAERDFAASADASIERWFPRGEDGRRPVPDEVVERVRSTLRANDPESYLACYRVFAEGDAEILPELPAITVPAVAVTGRWDSGSTPAMSVRLAELLPSCRVHIVDGARHMVPVERPDEIAEIITTIVEENS